MESFGVFLSSDASLGRPVPQVAQLVKPHKSENSSGLNLVLELRIKNLIFILHSGAENIKKTREIAFLAVLKFFPVQKLIFGHF